MSPTFKPRHTSFHWIVTWGIEAMVGDKGALGSTNWFVGDSQPPLQDITHIQPKWSNASLSKQSSRTHYQNKCWTRCIDPCTHVNHEIDNSIEIRNAWMVQSTHRPNVKYKFPLPFTHYACCMCEWALRGNLCKHQVAKLLTYINLTIEMIIHFCERWYGSNCGGFETMFYGPTYLHLYDNESNDEEPKANHIEDSWVVDVGELMT